MRNLLKCSRSVIVFVLIFVVVCDTSKNYSELIGENPKLKSRLNEAFCRHNCTHQETQCEIECNSINDSTTRHPEFDVVHVNSSMEKLFLKCKSDHMAAFMWNATEGTQYFLEIQDEDSSVITEIIRNGSFTEKGLKEDTSYTARLWGIRSVIIISEYLHFSTPSTRNKQNIRPVKNFKLQKFNLREGFYDAVVEWTPSEDLSCFYDFVWYGSDEIMGAYQQKEVNRPEDLFETLIPGLEFDRSYNITIVARSEDHTIESEKSFLEIKTQSCVQTYKDLRKCGPEVPQNLRVDENIVGMDGNTLKHDVKLFWSKPELMPHYYEARLINDPNGHNASELHLNATGNSTSLTFENVELDFDYVVALRAWSFHQGPSDFVLENRHVSTIITTTSDPWSAREFILIVLGPIFTFLVIIGLVFYLNHYRSKRERLNQRRKYFTNLENMSSTKDSIELDLIDKWELNEDKLVLQTVLGEGAFGIVRRASLEVGDGSKIEVAVKMLKDMRATDEMREFAREIEIMKSVKQHPYIVSLIGCITRNRPEGPWLVVEYCSRGDLQSYLRAAWNKIMDRQDGLKFMDESSNSTGYTEHTFSNRTYDIHMVDQYERQLQLICQPQYLISISRQIAMGMEHLAKTRVVHRDLAARNVLLCEDFSVKVSDFGLSRDIYQHNVYCKLGGGKLPIRWMALESLTHQIYTSQSDVWSYGVLLWEIVTLGSTPYAGVNSSDLLRMLKDGYRLERPPNCSSELFTIMQSCWKSSPKERPTFSGLCRSLDVLLENVSHYLNLDLDPMSPAKNVSSSHKRSNSSASYIRPLSK